MFRGLLTATATLAVLIATVVGVVGAGLRGIAVAKKQANAAWHPTAAPVPASQPTTAPALAADEPYVPQFDSIELWAKDATAHGSVDLFDPRDAQAKLDDEALLVGRRHPMRSGRQLLPYLRNFRTADDFAVWEFDVPKPGLYEVNATCACAQWAGENRFSLILNNTEFSFTVDAERGPNVFRIISLGKMTLATGKATIIVRPALTSSNAHTFLNLRNVLLVPVK